MQSTEYGASGSGHRFVAMLPRPRRGYPPLVCIAVKTAARYATGFFAAEKRAKAVLLKYHNALSFF